MAKLKFQGSAAGTGTVTLVAPTTDSTRTITLPDGDISLGVGIDDNATSTKLTVADTGIKAGSVYNDGVTVVVAGNSITYPADNTLAFNTSGTERMRILSTGGLTFNGDTAAANALDDYEEGTWTPAISGGTLTITTVDTASYTKIGNLVTVQFFLTLNNNGDGSSAIFSGLPFTVSTDHYYTGVFTNNNGDLTSTKFGRANSNTTEMPVYKNASSTALQTDIDGSWVICSLTYQTS